MWPSMLKDFITPLHQITKQFHQEQQGTLHTSHYFKVKWKKLSRIHKRKQSSAGCGMVKVAQSYGGVSCFVYLNCPLFSVPVLISAIHKATFKQVKEKKGKKLLCFLKVSRSHRVVRQSLLQPLTAGAWVCGFESVTFQRCITLLSETASVFLPSLMCHVKTGQQLPGVHSAKPCQTNLNQKCTTFFQCSGMLSPLLSRVYCTRTIKDMHVGISVLQLLLLSGAQFQPHFLVSFPPAEPWPTKSLSVGCLTAYLFSQKSLNLFYHLSFTFFFLINTLIYHDRWDFSSQKSVRVDNDTRAFGIHVVFQNCIISKAN